MIRVRLDVPLAEGARARLPDDQAHHLARVLRLRPASGPGPAPAPGAEGPGVVIEAVDGAGARWACALVRGDDGALGVEATERRPELGADPAAALEVWLPLLKGGRTDDLVRQLTELGATRVVPFVASRTVARPDARRAERQVARWRHIAAEATRQCGRAAPPEVEAVAGLPAEGPGVFFWEGGGAPARDVLARQAAGGSEGLRVLVGPEGGLAPEEARALEAAGWEAAWLGARVLRAETAVVAAAVLALHALGEGGY